MLKVRIDTREFVRGIRKLKNALPREMANSLNRAAGAARTAFNEAAVTEVGFKSPRGIVKPRTVELPNARTDRLVSTFTPSRVTKNMAVLGKFKPSTGRNARQVLTVATHGGKAFDKGFAIKTKRGGVILLDRTAGKNGKKPHALKTTSFSRLMDQEGSLQRRIWERTAEERLTIEMPVAVENAIDKAGLK